MTQAHDILTYWFQDLNPKDWWVGGTHIDAHIERHFGGLVAQALRGELYTWRTSAQGRLAEIICLDQFTRNIHRGTAAAFAGDPIALTLAQEAILGGHDADLSVAERSFLYMPLMHSESLAIHEWAAKLFDQPGMEKNLESLTEHTDVIAQFGRYPSRNAALGRDSTAAEMNYLKDGKTWGQA